eukprot:SAG11_NODE_1390_length_5055_cov_2.299637_4_plen_163_part_00
MTLVRHSNGTTIETSASAVSNGAVLPACHTAADGEGGAEPAAAAAATVTPPRAVASSTLADVSLDDFRSYQTNNAPIVLRGAVVDWPAADWSLEFFRENYGDVEVEVSVTLPFQVLCGSNFPARDVSPCVMHGKFTHTNRFACGPEQSLSAARARCPAARRR